MKVRQPRPLTISAKRVLATRGTMQADKRRRGDGHRKAVEKAAAPEDMKTWSEFCARLCVCACARACVCLCASVCLCVRVCALARTPNSVCLIVAWTQNRACTFPLCLLPSPPSPSRAAAGHASLSNGRPLCGSRAASCLNSARAWAGTVYPCAFRSTAASPRPSVGAMRSQAGWGIFQMLSLG